METLDEQYGFSDELFLSETPEYLKCVVCTLILRDPVQILTCGHKFCSVCFNRLQSHAALKNNTEEVRCPIDRDVVQLYDVREDVGLKRVIGSLAVRCGRSNSGCSWTGDLQQYTKHANDCTHQYQNETISGGEGVTTGFETVIKELEKRVVNCENLLSEKDGKLEEKDRQLAALQQQMQELVTKFDHKDNQLRDLKGYIEEFRKMKNQVCVLNNVFTSITTALANSTAVEAKHLNTRVVPIQRQRGEKEDMIFSEPGNHRIRFKDFSTVAAPIATVKKGMKAYYEVQYVEVPKDGFSQIGWATASLTKIDEQVTNGVGDVSRSYAFDPQRGLKWSPGLHDDWVSVAGKAIDGGQLILGVAIDLQAGVVTCSINGVWDPPIGAAFHGIDVDIDFFPALTAADLTVSVNFGERPFTYGPKDRSFQPINNLA